MRWCASRPDPGALSTPVTARRELDSDFAAQRIKKLSLFEAAKAAVMGGGGKKHKTLVDRFAYPTGGTGMVYEEMVESVRARGGEVHLETPVASVEARAGEPGAKVTVEGKGTASAENVTRGAGHDLWRVNTDYESYQESAIIDETGLVSK